MSSHWYWVFVCWIISTTEPYRCSVMTQPPKKLELIHELCIVEKDLHFCLLYWVLKLKHLLRVVFLTCYNFTMQFAIMFPVIKFTFTSYRLRFHQSNVTCIKFPSCVIYKWGQNLGRGLIRYCLLEDFHKCRSRFTWLSPEAEFLSIEINL